MHINEGAGMITNPSTGLVEFIDENLPGTPGSTVLAEWGNALTFEFKALLEAAGLTLETSATEDRTNGWHQLKTALFDSQALGTSALTDSAVTLAKLAANSVDTSKVSTLDLAKLFGELVLTAVDSVTEQMTLNQTSLEFLIDFTGGTIASTVLNGGGLTVTNTYGRSTKYLNGGMRSVGLGKEESVRLSVFDLSNTGSWNGTGLRWDGDLTGLLKTNRIFNAYVSFEDASLEGDLAGDGTSVYDGPAQYFGNKDNTTQFGSVTFSSVDSSDNYQGIVYIETDYATVDRSDYLLYVVHG